MRKITKDTFDAFINWKPLNKQNMRVEQVYTEDILHYTMESKIYLHGNLIAKRTKVNDAKYTINLIDKIEITLAWWNTNTTRERLNGLPWVRVTTKQGQAYLNGEKWNGEWTTIIL